MQCIKSIFKMKYDAINIVDSALVFFFCLFKNLPPSVLIKSIKEILGTKLIPFYYSNVLFEEMSRISNT